MSRPSWITEDLIDLQDAFEARGFGIRAVGGCVRDHFMGKSPSDVDLCSDALPETVRDICLEKGHRVIDTGLKHGTVTVLTGMGNYEITTLRIDASTDGRHAEVQFTDDWKLDAERRDFTFNAMSLNMKTMEVFDFFGGQADIEQKKLRFVGDANKRLEEDHLRALRFFRFMAKTGFDPDADTVKLVFRSAESMYRLSGERIWSELKKMVVQPHAHKAMRLMVSNHSFADQVFPYVTVADVDSWNGTCSVELSDPIFQIGKHVRSYTQLDWFRDRCKCSNDEYEQLSFYVNTKCYEYDPKDIREEMYWSRPEERSKKAEWMSHVLWYRGVTTKRIPAEMYEFPAMPISGNDFKNLNLVGSQMSDAIHAAKDHWLRSGFKATAAELIEKGVSETRRFYGQ